MVSTSPKDCFQVEVTLVKPLAHIMYLKVHNILEEYANLIIVLILQREGANWH